MFEQRACTQNVCHLGYNSQYFYSITPAMIYLCLVWLHFQQHFLMFMVQQYSNSNNYNDSHKRKVRCIKSNLPRDGCILALSIATSCLIFLWQSSQTLLGYGASILQLSTYEGKLTRPTTMNNINQAVSFATKQKAWNLDYTACKESSVR